jgi:hypothetical protein
VIVTVNRCAIFAFSLLPKADFVVCRVSECGRCYMKSLGYFYLHRDEGNTRAR